jgi:hypothetical protein
MPSLCSGLWSRDQNQLTAVQFAPTAHVAISELEEKDGTVMLVMPVDWRHCSLAGIDLHKRSRPNDRVQRVILHPDVPVKRIAPVYLPQQSGRNVPPIFNHLRHEVGSFGPQPLSEFESRQDRGIAEFRGRSYKICLRKNQGLVVSFGFPYGDIEEGGEFLILASVDDAKALELVNISC